MRGTHVAVLVGLDRQRIIPADAGNTPSSTPCRFLVEDHPRGCGEHLSGDSPESLGRGSSPRMRGTQPCLSTWHAAIRIIPADAGNTPSRGRNASPTQDHPRGCGEHMLPPSKPRTCRGSSPRMRGTLRAAPQLTPQAGIIPADAGNTSDFRWVWGCREDHPRGCGEHSWSSRLARSEAGSSPRMRGTRGEGLPGCGECGIIPADAGNTHGRSGQVVDGGDHPRGCGEHKFSPMLTALRWGSSPRMRGTQQRWAWFLSLSRIIPADAGNTGRD